jgi:hypothetical protein
MAQLAKALMALSALAFVLAVVTNFTGNYMPLWLTTAEGFSRACTNLALLAIGLMLGSGSSRP